MDHLNQAKRIFLAQQEEQIDIRDDLMESIAAANIAQAEFLQRISTGIDDLIEAIEKKQPNEKHVEDEEKQDDPESTLNARFYVTNTAEGYGVYDRKQRKTVVLFDGSIVDAYYEARSYVDHFNEFPKTIESD